MTSPAIGSSCRSSTSFSSEPARTFPAPGTPKACRLASIWFDRRDEIGNPQKSLANPPDATGAQKQFSRSVHVADLEMIHWPRH